MRSSLAPVLAVLSLALPTPAQVSGSARTWIVDAAGGGDFLDLQPAIDAAASGDAIVVRPAPTVYGTACLYQKDLTIVGEGPERVGVREVDAYFSDVVLRNLSIEPTGTLDPSAVRSRVAEMWIEDCEVRPAIGHDSNVFAIFSDLVLVRTEVASGVAGSPVPAPALILQDATAHAFACSFAGDASASQGTCPAQTGGIGAALGGTSFLFASGTELRGGRGGTGDGSSCASGPGGPGMNIHFRSEAQLLNCTLVPGYGGRGPLPGPDGVPVVLQMPSGNVPTFVQATTASRTYSVSPAVAGPGDPLTLRAEAPPGEFVLSLFASGADPTFHPLHYGTLLLAAPLTVVVEGPVPAGGVLESALAAPLPPSLPLALLRAQGLFLDGEGMAFLGAGSCVLVTR